MKNRKSDDGLAESMRVVLFSEKMIYQLKSKGFIKSRKVEDAFRAVPRHIFLPETDLKEVYSFQSVITKYRGDIPVSSSSQPPRMATMLEQLPLVNGQKILEVGAGTGFNAGLLAHIVGESGSVITLEIDEEIAASARLNLQSAGIKNVEVVCQDGFLGYASEAPYDCIVLTVGVWDISPNWVEQLKPGGVLLVPLWVHGEQRMIALQRKAAYLEDGLLESNSIERGGFVRLRGQCSGPEAIVMLDPLSNLLVTAENVNKIDIAKQAGQLGGKFTAKQLDIEGSVHELVYDFSIWLAAREPAFFALSADSEPESLSAVPFLFGYPKIIHAAYGLRSEMGCCVLAHPLSISKNFSDAPADDEVFQPFILNYGEDETLADQLTNYLQQWQRAGRPKEKNLTVLVIPIDKPYEVKENQVVLHKKWFKYVFLWK